MRQWPFDGREDALARIAGDFAGRRIHAVLLPAPAGAGKTRLAREALRQLGRRRLWIAATRAATAIPFGAMVPLVPDDLPPTAGDAATVRAIRARVAAWGGREAVAIAVDDAHLLDSASATVIAQLVAGGRAFVLLTARTGEPLADCLARLAADGVARVLELPPLPEAVLDRLIDHSTGGTVDAARRRSLRAGSGGNPMTLWELLHGAVPGGLIELVASRLKSLDAGTRAAVETVACGEPVPLGILEKLAGSAVVAAAEESGLLVCEEYAGQVQVRLEHPLHGEVLRERMARARARQIYRSLAEHLIATPLRRREDVLRAALWQVESGRVVRPDLVREGARHAVGCGELALAERLAGAAAQAEPGAEGAWLLAEILEYQGRGDEAAALVSPDPPARPAERVRWAAIRARSLYWGQGDLAGAMRALDAAGAHPAITASRASLLFFCGQSAAAAGLARAVLDRHDSDPQAQVWAAAVATGALGFLGRLEEAEKARMHGSAIAEAHAAALPLARFEMETGACLAHLAAGSPAAAGAIAAAGRRGPEAGEASVPGSVWALLGGLAALAAGGPATADRLLAEALTGLERADARRLRRLASAALAGARALRGDDRTAGELMAAADRLEDGTNEIFEPWIESWRAWVARAAGDGDSATSYARRAADRAAAAGQPAVEALALYDVARLGGAADLDRLDALEGPLPDALGTAARALATGDAAGLGRAAGLLDALGHHLHAAELATAAAHTLRVAGRRGPAGLVAAEAVALRAKCQDARTPMLDDLDLGDVLSVRERQVALLAVRHTSKQIATRLGLAVRTVDNTLARVYTKLGISGRGQLRSLLTAADQPQDAG
ncbi:helix-turn-helix transcriptional regulator [Nonomuraea jiangxiensis]|uniref:Regulatory protein, luxR family n=1 Tax=Nonomuraea jiangxiensis TaxID=633440 RepID=A0A1G9IXZ9_9ACTN|nr:LuxR family transcriptional regulator [Nonomuraea jiangxiensis]SDL30090.1 regulatory protein, luxR family [Nonomuraea jiangxiensis]